MAEFRHIYEVSTFIEEPKLFQRIGHKIKIVIQEILIQIMNKPYRVSGEDPLFLYSYNVRIMNVKMKVKFQCKMKLQIDSEPITTEVPISDGSIFVFNQDCSLVHKSSEEDSIGISITLVTNKGAKYIAGIAMLYIMQLAKAVDTGPSSRIVVTLSKCLDPQATLEIVVKQSVKMAKAKVSIPARQQSKSKINKPLNIYSYIEGSHIQSRKYQASPPLSPRGFDYNSFHNATRSQVNLPRGIGIKTYETNLSRADTLQKGKSRSRSRRINERQRDKNSVISKASFYHNSFGLPLTERNKDIADYIDEGNLETSQAYKNSYLRLKQKLKKQENQAHQQHEKRVNLEVSEAATRLQALKFKMKCEQLQKNVSEKSESIVKLELRIQQLQRILRGESFEQRLINNKMGNIGLQYQINQPQKIFNIQQNDANITMLENKVNMANKQLQEFKNKVLKITKAHSDKQVSLLKELERRNMRINKLEEQLMQKNNYPRNDDSLKFSLEQKQKIICGLQREQDINMKKISELERAHKMLQKSIDELKLRGEQTNRNLTTAILERQKAIEQVQNEKNRNKISELTISSLKQNIERLQNELQNNKSFKQKYHDNLVEMKRIEGERKLELKNFQNTIKLSESSMLMIKSKQKQQIDTLIRKNQQLQTKNLQQSLKIRQMESYVNTTVKAEAQGMRRMNEKLQKDCQEYRNGERQVRREYASFESTVSQLKSQVEVWKNKLKSLENISKLQNQKYSNELNRAKAALEQELINQMHIKQKNQGISTELVITQNKLHTLEEKYSKEIKQLSNRLDNEVDKNNKLKQMLRKQEQLNTEVRDKEKQLMNKIQQYGENQNEYSDLIKRYENELSKLKNALSLVQDKLQRKQEQLEDVSKQLKQTSQKYIITSQKLQEVSFEIKNVSGELQKQVREKQKMQLQLINCKNLNQSKQKSIQKLKLTIDQENKQKMDLKEQLHQAIHNHQNVSKLYEQFRDQIYDILLRQFTGIDGLQNFSTIFTKNRQSHSNLKQALTKNTTEGDLFNLQRSRRLNANKNSMDKMTKSVYTLHNHSTSNNHLNSSPPAASNNNEIFNAITQFSRQSKGLINKFAEEYRFLDKQFEYAKQIWQQKEGKQKQEMKKAQQTIQELEYEMSCIFNQKEGLQEKLNHTTNELKQEIVKTKNQLQKSNTRYEELLFINNGLKMEREAEKQYYEMKINHFNSIVMKLEYSISNLSTTNTKLENDLKKCCEDKQNLERDHRKSRQGQQAKDRKIRQLEHEKVMNTRLLEDTNGKNKQYLSQISELELLLANQREKNGKNMQIISQQEKKLVDTKDFVNSLIKQKQAIVKQDIQNGKKIVQLQSMRISMQHEMESLKLKLQAKTTELLNQKESNKKLTSYCRQLQISRQELSEEKIKISDELKQKQRQLVLVNQNIKNKEVQLGKEINIKVKQLQQLSGNKELLQKLSNQEIANMKKQLSKCEQEITNLRQQIRVLNRIQNQQINQVDNLNKILQQKEYEINSYKQIQQKMITARNTQEQQLNKYTNELRDKQQQLYNTTGQLYQLQQKMQQQGRQLQREKEEIMEQYDYKFDNMCEDYQTKIDQMERQRQYLKQKIAIGEEQINKYSVRIKELEYDENKGRIYTQDVITKIQEEKNYAISGLKLELKKVSESRQRLEEEGKKKDIELQKLRAYQQSSKNLTYKLEQKLKQHQIKIDQLQQQLVTQNQNIKKKQLHLREYEQNMKNYQWGVERQTKKELQNLIKSIISISSQNSEIKRKLTDLIKEVESKICRVVTDQIVPGSAFIVNI